MRILVVGQFFYPDHFRVNDIVKNFIRLGHQVTVVTGLPDYETGYIPDEFKGFKKRREDYFGAEVIRVPIIQRRSGAFFRALNYISFVCTATLYLLFKKDKYDKVFVFQTSPVTMAIPAIIYGKWNKVETVLYCLDIWPECVKAMSIKEGSLAFRIIHWVSIKTYHAADKILVSSKSFLNYLSEYNHVPLEKIQYLPQYTDEDSVLADALSAINVANPVRFLFAGNIGLVQDIETIVEAVIILSAQYDFHVDLVGSGSNLERIEQMIYENKLEDYISLHGRKMISEMDAYYNRADVCLLTLKNTGKIGMTVPGKLQTYMAKGKAIAAAIDGDSVEVIELSQSGFAVGSGDYKGLSDIMEKYIRNRSLIMEHGKNALMYYRQNFDREIFFEKLIKIMEV